MDNKVVLGYWQIRGLAERVRMLLEYTGLPYSEEKYNADNRDKWFQEIKPELSKKNPAITLPYLLDGDKVISESDAVVFYILHKSGKLELFGRNADEQVAAATAYGVMRDIHSNYVSLVYGRYGDKPFEEAKPEFIEKFRPGLQKLNLLLNERQFVAGEITWVDFAVADFMQTLRLMEPALIQEYANINSHIDRIWELPAIKAYH